MLHTTSNPILCYVTDRRTLAAGENESAALVEKILAAISASVDWIQIREKDLPARVLAGLVEQAVAAARGTPTRILVNDRLDVALAAGAAGVHLGGESLPVVEVARWCRGVAQPLLAAPKEFLIGASCHSLDEVSAAAEEGADYVAFGPVFETPAKLRFGPPQGIERLAEVCRAVRIPVLAIGGVTLENAPECLRAGAAGLAAIRLFQQARDLSPLIATLRTAR